jgi:integrase
MPRQQRCKTKYPGVYWIEGQTIGTGKAERIYYICYRKGGKLIEEKAGRQFQDDMTPARAAQIRTERLQGKQPSNKQKREAIIAEKNAEKSKWTIERLWEEYKKTKELNKGLRTDDGRYKKFLHEFFGKKEPTEILMLDIDRLRLKLLKLRAPQTVRNVLSLLQRIVNFGVNRNLCGGLPFRIQKPKVSNTRTEDLNHEQLRALLIAIEKDENIQAKNLMKMALFTGMRRGELFKLKWEDVDFTRGFIHIRDPKGGQDQLVPLNDQARQVLESHPKSKSEFVFPGRHGNQRVDINHQVNRIKAEAGLPEGFRPLHGLRHVYASMLASSGQVDMYTLQRLLTHKDPRMTQRYAHLRDDALKKASNLAGQLVNEASETNENARKEKVVKSTNTSI